MCRVGWRIDLQLDLGKVDVPSKTVPIVVLLIQLVQQVVLVDRHSYVPWSLGETVQCSLVLWTARQPDGEYLKERWPRKVGTRSAGFDCGAGQEVSISEFPPRGRDCGVDVGH